MKLSYSFGEIVDFHFPLPISDDPIIVQYANVRDAEDAAHAFAHHEFIQVRQNVVTSLKSLKSY